MGAANAYDSLRKVLGFAGTRIVEDACVHLPIQHGAVGADGLIADPAIREQIRHVLTVLRDAIA